jgi:exosortase/archaeosortase family protein
MVVTIRLKKNSFILRFTLLFAITYPLVIFFEIRPYEDLLAKIVSVLLSIFTLNHEVFGNIIYVGETAFSVDPSCTGFVSVVLLLSMVLSVGIVNRKQQFRVFLLGSAFLLSWNVLRVFLLVIAGPLMDLAHFSLWMVSGLFIFVFWYSGIVKKLKIKLV